MGHRGPNLFSDPLEYLGVVNTAADLHKMGSTGVDSLPFQSGCETLTFPVLYVPLSQLSPFIETMLFSAVIIAFMNNYSDIHDAIAIWYARNGRHDLPWRGSHDPYVIYISEMMLQQTRVETVRDRFFFPFLQRFPTLQSIADASLEEVLHAWQGLGYYRRARYIHQTARIASPELPIEPEALMKLPGIGRSTAHAIAAFAAGVPVAVLDANVKRVLHRFFAQKSRNEREQWKMAETLLDRNDPYTYNQAMMDIGATICLPKNPKCEVCPLQSRCRGQEKPADYPEPRKRKKRPERTTHYLWIEKGRKIRMRRREEEMLGGLWELPTAEEPPEGSERLFSLTHDYSHFRRIAVVHRWKTSMPPEGEWIDAERLHEIPVSSLERKIFARLFETDTD